MKVMFTPEAWEDYLYWQKHDKRVLKRINEIVKNILTEPFAGIGKPEPLKHQLQGYWSRRITPEHRLIYYVNDSSIDIVSVKNHY